MASPSPHGLHTDSTHSTSKCDFFESLYLTWCIQRVGRTFMRTATAVLHYTLAAVWSFCLTSFSFETVLLSFIQFTDPSAFLGRATSASKAYMYLWSQCAVVVVIIVPGDLSPSNSAAPHCLPGILPPPQSPLHTPACGIGARK